LIAAVAQLDDRAATTPIDFEAWDGDTVVVERRMPLADLLGVINEHAAGHAKQRAELQRTARPGERC
jgi:hypothetical protein